MKIKVLFYLTILLVSCVKTEPRHAVNIGKVSSLEKSVAVNKLLYAKERERMQAYMDLDSVNTYINSNKGFWYAYITKNEKGVCPKKGDHVSFEQEINALDGTVLYAKKEVGLRNYVVDKEHVIKGIKEGIKVMRTGEEVKFLFSSFVAYRMNGDTKQIYSNEPLISKIKLIEIN